MTKKTKDRRMKKVGASVTQSQSLTDQIKAIDEVTPTNRSKKVQSEEHDEFVGGKSCWNIERQRKAQLKEIEEEDKKEFPSLSTAMKARKPKRKNDFFNHKPHLKADSDDSDSDNETFCPAPEDVDKAVSSFQEELKLTDAEQKVLDFAETDRESTDKKTLADFFRSKIIEKQSEIQSQVDAESVCDSNLSPEVQESCKRLGKVLSRYRSGVLPKLLKAIPRLKNWEELVCLSEPETWSAGAMYQCTRIFVSQLNDAMAQRFFNMVLLPRVRDDISSFQKLNHHLYQSLFKAMFKPAAFNKGILLPLCVAGDCTLREAIIIGSVVAKHHIPIEHSAAAILKISEMDYSGANSIFLRIFFNKKYALPYQVLDAVVGHFMRYNGKWANAHNQELPVLWFQALLVFAQRYKTSISIEQKEALRELLKGHYHYQITPEIQRELDGSIARGEGQPMEEMECE